MKFNNVQKIFSKMFRPTELIVELTIEEKVSKINKNTELPSGCNFYIAIQYYKSEANKVLGGKGLLSNFNTACMEYCMISEPRRVLYGNGLPHDLSYAEGYELDLFLGLKSFLEKNFPQYTKDTINKEFDEVGHYNQFFGNEEDKISESDLLVIQQKVQEARKDPRNWSV